MASKKLTKQEQAQWDAGYADGMLEGLERGQAGERQRLAEERKRLAADAVNLKEKETQLRAIEAVSRIVQVLEGLVRSYNKDL